MILKHEELARQWVREDNAGFILSFKYVVPDNPNERIKMRLYIYDVVGHLVHHRESDNFTVPAEWEAGAQKDVDIYWSGTNRTGRFVAKGMYRTIMFLESKTIQRKIIGTVGVQ